MTGKGVIPDAWDDDWEAQADRQGNLPSEPTPPPPRMTKAEKLAQHAETNRKLWELAESSETFHFVEANNNVPLTSNFKPQVKVLSRKPPTQTIARRDLAGSLNHLSVGDDEDEEDGEGNGKQAQLTPQEIRDRQQREREEKQRRYDEARAKIFGDSSRPSSGTSTPGTVTPPRPDSRGGGQYSRGNRGRGRGRGGANSARQPQQQQPQQQQQQQQYHPQRQDQQSQADSSRRSETRELYDPNYSPKPGFSLQKRSGSESGRSSPKDQAKSAIRAPRGPDGSGRGGFGFARRGAKAD